MVNSVVTADSAYEKTTAFAMVFMVETTGIEPVTPCMSSKYSNQLSYASKLCVVNVRAGMTGFETCTRNRFAVSRQERKRSCIELAPAILTRTKSQNDKPFRDFVWSE